MQLTLHPAVHTKNQVKRAKRGKAGFHSSDAYWLQVISLELPELTLFIYVEWFSGLLDAGTDISVITSSQ